MFRFLIPELFEGITNLSVINSQTWANHAISFLELHKSVEMHIFYILYSGIDFHQIQVFEGKLVLQIQTFKNTRTFCR